MEYKVHYNGQETNDFDTLASWFKELKKENERLKEANEQHRDDYIRLKQGYDEFKLLNRSLKHINIRLKAERRKTNEVLKRYCGDSVDTPISTMVGLIIDDYFYQKAEAEFQIIEAQKAEKTIDNLNKELVGYADRVEELEEELKKDEKIIVELGKDTVSYANKVADQRERINELEEANKNWEKKLWDPDWCRLIDKLNEMIDKQAPIPCEYKKVYTSVEDEIWDKLDYLTRALCMRNTLNDAKNEHIRELENKVNDLDVAYRKLKLENEKLILVQGDNAVEHAAEITVLKQEISALKKELEECKNKRSTRWPSFAKLSKIAESLVPEACKDEKKAMNPGEIANYCLSGTTITMHSLRYIVNEAIDNTLKWVWTTSVDEMKRVMRERGIEEAE